jgi:rod shape determining protein RodA
MLFVVIFAGVEVNGSKSWFMIGPVRVQPAELAKITTSLALASMMSAYNFRLKTFSSLVKVGLVILTPMLLIIMEKETGSALVFASFLFVLYREGLSGWYLTFGILAIVLFVVTLAFSSFTSMILLFVIIIIAKTAFSKKFLQNILFLAIYLPILILSPKMGEIKFIPWALTNIEWLIIFMCFPLLYFLYKAIREKTRYMKYILLSFFVSTALIFSVQFFFDEVLQDHQRARIENLLGVTEDLQGAGYNVHQSKIAIGSGGLFGKGFLKGTQTKFNFVPEQSTDFIFCTVGEEWGFAGSVIVIGLFLFLLIRILTLAERQKDNFTRIYGYALASVIFLHFFINIGMTIGIMPVIGIPLPFVSYGGSSLWAFTIFLFIFIRLDIERWK